jgi:GNAT superfamily N-acetyltransferase
MNLRVVTYAERPELEERWDETVGPAWPEFLLHDATVNELWAQLFEIAPEHQFYVVDGDTDSVVCVGNSLPFRWDRDPASLPDGVDGVLPLAIEQHETGIAPNTLCAMQAIVVPSYQGQGHAPVPVRQMADAARRVGFADLVAPVRPSWKHRFPLIPMQEYASWARSDGLPFDPWFRVHARLGASFLQVCPNSMRIVGTVDEWRAWTALEFPGSGSYPIPGALVPIAIDVARDEGVYVEPNQWMHHPIR